jgi:hypothetical protein
MPLLVSHRGYPEDFFELDENYCVGKSTNKTFAGLLVIPEGECMGILLNASNGRLDFLPELASKPGSLPLVKEDCFVQVPPRLPSGR